MGFALLTGALAATGAWMVYEGQPFGWLVGGFFALCALTFLWLLFGDFGVALDHDGFEVRTLFTRKRFRWVRVSLFSPYRTQGAAMILFDDDDWVPSLLGDLKRNVVGKTESIPAILLAGSVEDAAALMNRYRAEARGEAV